MINKRRLDEVKKDEQPSPKRMYAPQDSTAYSRGGVQMTTAPKKIHFIWTGGNNIPVDYMNSILKVAKVAKKSGYEFNLWVDEEKNFHKSFANYRKETGQTGKIEQDLFGFENINKVLDIKLRHPDELLPRIETDEFYQSDNRRREFKYNVAREMIGLNNFAAAADFLRYEILRQEGGCYFDTDTKFVINENSKFIPDDLPLGIKTNINFDTYSYNIFDVGNDIIEVIPDHLAIEYAILHALNEYKRMDSQNELKEMGICTKKAYLQLTHHFIHNDTTMMDTKRYPWARCTRYIRSSRWRYTIGASGPDALAYGIDQLLKSKDEFSQRDKLTGQAKDKLFSIALKTRGENGIPRDKVANIELISASAQSWLKKDKPEIKGMSFDDNMPNTIFGARRNKISR